MSAAATIAANRFGLGARPGELAVIGSDPQGWLNGQIKSQLPLPALPTARQRIGALRSQMGDVQGTVAEMLRAGRQNYAGDVVARTKAAVTARAPFAERLVYFWSNHLTVSVDRAVVSPFAVAYENEAIRPYVFGRFADMLLASARHPAMLLYLDNIRSFGPNSQAVQRGAGRGNNPERPKGLNENYARELMELHTLGVDGGYTQTDVRTLAKILTGWSLDRERGGFLFRAPVHEPGAQSILGRTFADAGEQQGVKAIEYLATHPATAKHIARKLAQHFIADDPPQSAINALAHSFMQTGGDLAAVTHTLIGLPEAWGEQPLKYKSPHEHVVSAFRALGLNDIDEGIVQSYEVLGQRAFGAPSPQGWPDAQDKWLSGDGLMRRVEWSQAVSSRLGHAYDARKIAPQVLGNWLSGDTVFLLQGAPTAQDALALLFLAPEFQRR